MNVSKKYESLNGLRVIAALGIALMHYRVFIPVKPTMGIISDNVIPFFTEFVFLFFMVSAFGLCCGYYHKFLMQGKSSLFDTNKFYSRRFVRIWPFFAILVCIDVVMTFVGEHYSFTHVMREEIYQAIADLTLCFNLLPNPDIKVIGGGWFLGTIFVFYMIFPFFVFLLKTKKRAWFAMSVAIVLYFLIIRYFLTEEFVLQSEILNARHNILYSFPFFMVGGLLFLYKEELTLNNRFGKLILLFFCIFFWVGYLLFPSSCFHEKRLLLLLLFSLWIIYALSGGLIIYKRKILNNRVMTFLSGISMEIYLSHMMMFRVVEKIHFENIIKDPNILYIVWCTIGISLAIVFSWVVKHHIFPFLSVFINRK